MTITDKEEIELILAYREARQEEEENRICRRKAYGNLMSAINDFEEFGGTVKIMDEDGVSHEMEGCDFYEKEIVMYFKEG